MDCLPARSVFAYAVACLEREAAELARSIDVALVPLEASAGGSSLRKRLERDIRRMSGGTLSVALSSVEQIAIAEVELEIAHDFPFYFDEARLNKMHDALGMLRLK